MKKMIAFAALIFLVVLCGTPAYASGIPALPHAFYGNVTINGSPAPAGTIIEARGTGVLTGIAGNPITTTVAGKYGGADALDTKLVVQGDVASGAVIEFWVNGIYTGQTCLFKSGETTELGLLLEVTNQSITAKAEKTVTGEQTDTIALPEANTTITVSAATQVTITVEKYYGNPHPEATLPANMLPRFIDIEVGNLDAVVWPIHVEQGYIDAEVVGLDESSLGMYYFKAGAWHRCSDTGTSMVANHIWANMVRDELSGSPIAVGGLARTYPVGGGITPHKERKDTTPPVITDVEVSGIYRDAADITWTTDEPSTSQVEYGSSPSQLTAEDTRLVTYHYVRLSGLSAGTTYWYFALSRDKAGNLSVSKAASFITESISVPPVSPPPAPPPTSENITTPISDGGLGEGGGVGLVPWLVIAGGAGVVVAIVGVLLYRRRKSGMKKGE